MSGSQFGIKVSIKNTSILPTLTHADAGAAEPKVPYRGEKTNTLRYGLILTGANCTPGDIIVPENEGALWEADEEVRLAAPPRPAR